MESLSDPEDSCKQNNTLLSYNMLKRPSPEPSKDHGDSCEHKILKVSDDNKKNEGEVTKTVNKKEPEKDVVVDLEREVDLDRIFNLIIN